MLASLSSTLTSQVASHGAYAVFLLMAIDAVFPAASELVMLYAGAVAAGVFTSAHHVSVFGAKVGFGAGAYVVMALAGTLGYLAGAIVGWWVGLVGGRPLLERRGRWLHVTPERLDRAERWFGRWGNLGVLVGRLTPVVRSFVSIPAGVFEMRFWPYTLLTLVGSAIWAFGIAGAGYGLGSSYERFHHDFRYVEIAIVAGVVALLAYLIYRTWRAATVRRRDDPAG
ncbi:MAG TPA: DedA family protein [Gaiellaceae bacterium]|nr:DedA family protein [Gaiellaceae bacterium]